MTRIRRHIYENLIFWTASFGDKTFLQCFLPKGVRWYWTGFGCGEIIERKYNLFIHGCKV